MFSETARAKINLTLHVGRLVDDTSDQYFGYHPLSSLVVFADFGDELKCEKADETSLSVSGPFAKGLETDRSNLILRAYDAVAAQVDLPPLKFHLVKNLPLASGIGGGSADAAAALRLMKNYVNLPGKAWHDIALSLGADVPVCLHSKTCVMSGIGDRIDFQPGKGQLSALLINPNFQVSTKTVFRAFDQTGPGKDPAQQPAADHLLEWARQGSNDLEGLVLSSDLTGFEDDLDFVSKKQLLRMSGSGATFVVVYETNAEAKEAQADLLSLWETTRPHWWVQPVMLGDLP